MCWRWRSRQKGKCSRNEEDHSDIPHSGPEPPAKLALEVKEERVKEAKFSRRLTCETRLDANRICKEFVKP
jgi:hypothetical protein